MLMREINAPTNHSSNSGAARQLPGTSPRSRRSARRAIAMFSIWRQSDWRENLAHNKTAPFNLPGGGRC
jgi:hypothetical protein